MKKCLEKFRSGQQDSPRSWLITVGCGIINFFCFGIIRASGVLFTALLENQPGITREDVSWPFTLSGSAIIIAGPLTGYLSTRFSIRTVTIAGVVVCTIGSGACYFYTDIIFVSAFFGVVRGVGVTLSTVPIASAVSNNFKRFRATAMGVANSGISLGGFVIPLVVQYSLDKHNLKITFLIIGAMSFLMMIGALPMTNRQKAIPKNGTSKDNLAFEMEERSTVDSLSSDNIPNEKKQTSIRTISFFVPVETYSRLEWTAGYDESDASNIQDDNCESTQHRNTSDNVRRNSTAITIVKSILRSKGFYLITMTGISVFISNGMYSLTVVDYTADKGLSKQQGVYLLTGNAAAELVGTVLLGWICDKNLISRRLFLAATLSVSATALLLFVFLKSFSGLLASAILLGVAQGGNFTISNVIYPDYIPLKDMVMAVSLSRAIIGVTFLPRAPLIGYFRDYLGTYDYLYYLMLGLLYLTGVIWTFEDIYQRSRPIKEGTNHPQ